MVVTLDLNMILALCSKEAVKTKLFTFNGLFSIAINLPSSPIVSVIVHHQLYNQASGSLHTGDLVNRLYDPITLNLSLCYFFG